MATKKKIRYEDVKPKPARELTREQKQSALLEIVNALHDAGHHHLVIDSTQMKAGYGNEQRLDYYSFVVIQRDELGAKELYDLSELVSALDGRLFMRHEHVQGTPGFTRLAVMSAGA